MCSCSLLGMIFAKRSSVLACVGRSQTSSTFARNPTLPASSATSRRLCLSQGCRTFVFDGVASQEELRSFRPSSRTSQAGSRSSSLSRSFSKLAMSFGFGIVPRTCSADQASDTVDVASRRASCQLAYYWKVASTLQTSVVAFSGERSLYCSRVAKARSSIS